MMFALMFPYLLSAQSVVDDASSPEAATDHSADREAIGRLAARFARAIETRDAEAIAACWTSEGEYVADDGTAMRTRKEIEAAYAQMFAQAEGDVATRIAFDRDSLRFTSSVSAVEEGHVAISRAGAAPVAERFSALYVKEDGDWLFAIFRRWPTETVSLRDLAWLVGEWSAESDEGRSLVSYDWFGDRKFLRGEFRVEGEAVSRRGVQFIGFDAVGGVIRSWTFDDSGAFSISVWSRDAETWMTESVGYGPDGSKVESTNLLTYLSPTSFTWQSVERELNGEPIEDVPPVKVTRISQAHAESEENKS